MPTVKEGASAFLASKRIAVTGVSRKPQRHGGDAVYKRLRERGEDRGCNARPLRQGQEKKTRDMVKQSSKTHQDRAAPARKHRWLRWAAAGLATVVVLAFAGLFVFIHFLSGPVPAPLALPRLNAAAGGTGSAQVNGTWIAGGGSLGGYRAREDFLGPGNTMVGRTSAVTGSVVIAHDEVTSVSLRVDLATVTANGKTEPQFAKILDTASLPDATFTLTKPIAAGSGLVMNKAFTVQATGLLSMHGTTHRVTFQATARYSGSLLEATGSIPVVFSDWNIHTPQFLQNHGLLEFLLVLRR